MSHASDCDLEVYGKLPNANGVICTCDQDDGDDASPDGDEEPRDMSPVAHAALAANAARHARVTLVGDAATAYQRFQAAAVALRSAQAKHAEALQAFTEAVAK